MPSPSPVLRTTNDASSSSTTMFRYTHLEVNGMLWSVDRTTNSKKDPQSSSDSVLSMVIDPIASQLDFGIPMFYRANKRILSEAQTLDMIVDAQPSYCLLSQGLDDHTHLPTLEKLIQRLPQLEFIVAPSAQNKLASILTDSSKIRVLAPGETLQLTTSVGLTATEGALVGPPWQARENGWLLDIQTSNDNNNNNKKRIYMEPHADATDAALERIPKPVDVLISPITQQSLPAFLPEAVQFPLVRGGLRTLEIAKLLQARLIVPLGNGELETSGPLAEMVQAKGFSMQELTEQEGNRDDDSEPIQIAQVTPGEPLSIPL